MRLNLGSSDAHLKSFVNVDIAQPCDQVADLSLPWPWEDSSVEEIVARDIFEHIGDCIHIGPQYCQKCEAYRTHFEYRSVTHNLRSYGKMRHWSGRIHVMAESWRVLVSGGRLVMECPDAAQGAGHFQDPTHVSPWTPNGLQYYEQNAGALLRFKGAYEIEACFKVLKVTERRYKERGEVWKFTAVLEAVK